MGENQILFIKKNLHLLINIFFLIIIIILLFVIIRILKNDGNSRIIHDNNKNSSFLFTNPILDCEINNANDNSSISFDDISKKVESMKNKYSLDHISLYFRDLNNGPWIGVNEKEYFSPASLLKVPLLIEFLHEAESNPSVFDKKVLVKPQDVNKSVLQNIVFGNNLIVDKEYTMNEVVESMIKKSDNTAVLVLFNNIIKENIGDVFKSVGVPYQNPSTEVNVRVKDYAGFFRILFNSSYLNRDMSEKALKMLTESEYNNGLVSGVPKGTIVAHKFGERNVIGGNDQVQLHDCGIIYYPNKPYILCIMTRGKDFKVQEEVIKNLSSYVYQKIDSKK